MHLVTENVDNEIHDLVEKISEYPIAWRAVHCLWPEVSTYHLQEMANALRPILSQDDSFLFQWGKEDIFILCRGVRTAGLDQAKDIMCASHRKLFPQDEDDCKVSVYDLSLVWDDFQNFFGERKKAVEAQQEEEQDDYQKKLTTSIKREDLDEEEVRRIREELVEKNKHNLDRRATRTGTTILVADGDPQNREILGELLKGCRVITALDGEQALDRYFSEAPDMLFFETNLSKMDGWEFLQYVHDYDPTAYTVMMSDQAEIHEVQKAKDLGVKGYLRKPYTKANVDQYVKHFYKNAPQHKRVS